MAAGLLQLVSTGVCNDYYPLNYTMETDILNLKSNNSTYIVRNGDTIIFETLIIPSNINFEHISSFEIKIGGSIVWNIPFELLLKLIPPKCIGNNYYITFDKNLFGETKQLKMLTDSNFELPLIALVYNVVTITLKSSLEFSYNIITKYVFYNTEIRRSLAEGPHEFKITQYHTLNINNYETKINAGCVSPGMYIKTYSPITKYTLQLQGLTHTKLSKDLIEYYKNLISTPYVWSKKHSLTLEYSLNKLLPKDIINVIEGYVMSEIKSEYLYYFPVSQIGYVHDENLTINTSCIEVVVKIETEDGNHNGQIYVKGKNIFRVSSEMIGVVYSTHF